MARLACVLLLVATLARAASVNTKAANVTAAASCAYAQNTDYNGGDLMSPGSTYDEYKLAGIASVEACCTECIAVNDCGAFSYGNDVAGGDYPIAG
jgi:hypothetical protein